MDQACRTKPSNREHFIGADDYLNQGNGARTWPLVINRTHGTERISQPSRAVNFDQGHPNETTQQQS